MKRVIYALTTVFGAFYLSAGNVYEELLPVPSGIADRSKSGWYVLTVKNGKAEIEGDEEGKRYGRATFRQLERLSGGSVPDGVVKDSPALKYRGLLLDTGRNYQDVDSDIRWLSERRSESIRSPEKKRRSFSAI